MAEEINEKNRQRGEEEIDMHVRLSQQIIVFFSNMFLSDLIFEKKNTKH
jgi:hypothetical protein